MNSSHPISSGLQQRPMAVIVLSLLALIFGMGLGAISGGLVAKGYGIDVSEIMALTEPRSLVFEERQGIRWFNLIAHIFSFSLAAILVAALARGEQGWSSFFQFKERPGVKVVVWSVLLLVAMMPLIQAVNWLNSSIPLPDWMSSMENSQNWLVGEVLRMEGLGELLLAMFVAAVAPAVGEELFFRGLIQPQLQKLTANPHLGIWLAAALFSAIHLQFAGFFPRMLLGAFLGYLLWWSGSLWLPILIHFLFNGIQIVGTYLYPDAFEIASEATTVEAPDFWLVGLSIVLVAYIGWQLSKETSGSATVRDSDHPA